MDTTMSPDDWMVSIPDLDGPDNIDRETDDFFKY